MNKKRILLLLCLGAMACKDPVQQERDRIVKEFDSINQRLTESNRAARTESEQLLDAFDSLEKAQQIKDPNE